MNKIRSAKRLSNFAIHISNYNLPHRWIFGMVGCKLVSFLTLVNMYGSVFFLVAMSIDRFLAVVMAVRARQVRNYRNAFLCCLFVWVAAVSIASEALVLRNVEEVG